MSQSFIVFSCIYLIGLIISFLYYIKQLETSAEDSVLRYTHTLIPALMAIMCWPISVLILLPSIIKENTCSHESDYQKLLNNVLSKMKNRHYFHDGLDLRCSKCNKHFKIELDYKYGFILNQNLQDYVVDAIVELNRIVGEIKYKHQKLDKKIINRYRNVYKILTDRGLLLPKIQELLPEKFQDFIISEKEHRDFIMTIIISEYEDVKASEYNYIKRRIGDNLAIRERLESNNNNLYVQTLLKSA